MKKLKIAILGSSSHIAKGLINNFLQNKKFSLHLYTMSPKKTHAFVEAIGNSPVKNCVTHKDYDDLLQYSYDVIINCIGVGTHNKLQGNYTDYFTVTEKYDDLAIKYCSKHSSALYICFSSGAVYGRNFSAPMEENTANCIKANHVTTTDYYSITRLNSEAKHRAFTKLNIVDLRIFSYFSSFMDLADGYFITEIMDCILNNKILMTNDINIIRDYIHPTDLFSLIKKCIDIRKINAAFDVSSTAPITKKEILNYFSCTYGLKHKVNQLYKYTSATGLKNIYYSKYNKILAIDFKPSFSSMDTIKQEAKYILE
jgi:nucleoside-diphosphate-sugar epimerase